MMHGIQIRSAADVARELDIHWEVHRIVQGPTGLQRIVCVNWVQRTPQMMT